MPIILQNMNDLKRIEYGAFLGQEFNHWRKRQRVTPLQEPQFVGFLCLGCGKRHAQLAELIECHEKKRKVTAA